jgi:4-hydroxybenzoyl-CoA thioesterase
MSGQVFTSKRRVRFADCDAAGIVFFPRYLEMLNGAVEDWFAGPLSLSFSELHLDRGESVPTAALEARFAAPSRLEDELDLFLSVVRIGRTSLRLRHRIEAAGELRLEAIQTLVRVGRSMKPEPWTDELRARMALFLEMPR